MTLADKFQVPDASRFPSFESGSDWFSYDLDGLTKSRFNNFLQAQLAVNIRMYAGVEGGTTEHNKKYVEGTFNGVVFINKNQNAYYDDRVDEKLADIRVFVSEDGTFLLREYEKLNKEVKADEIAIFIETGNDTFSGNVMLIKAGANAVEYTKSVLQSYWMNGKYTLSEAETNELLGTISNVQSFWSKVVMLTIRPTETLLPDVVLEFLSSSAENIEKFFTETIRLKESVWNKADNDYLLKDFEKASQELKDLKIEYDKFKNSLGMAPQWVLDIFLPFDELVDLFLYMIDHAEDNWAFLCGVWNGLMDLIGGIFGLIHLIFEAIKSEKVLVEHFQFYKSLALEYIDNAIQAIQKIDFKEVILHTLKSAAELEELIESIPDALKNKIDSLNSTHLNYYSGYIAANLIGFEEAFVNITKVAKIAKVEEAVTFFDKIAERVSVAEKKITNIVEEFFKPLENFINTLKKGTKKITEWIDEIFAKIRKWIRDVFGIIPEDEMIEGFEKGKIKADEFADGKRRKIGDHTRYSNYAEIKARRFLEKNEFQIGKNKGTLKYISPEKVTDFDAPIRKGIDGVYEFSSPPPKYVITEVKMNTKNNPNWKPTLAREITSSGGSQMTDKWIRFNLKKEFDRKAAIGIFESYETVLIGVSKNSKPIIKTLDKTGKIIKDNIKFR